MPQDAFGELRAEGRLPHGTMGEVEFRDLWSAVDRFARRLVALRPAAPLRSIDAQWDIAGFNLAVRLAGLSENGCLRYRFGKLRARDHLNLWLQHLALCLAWPGPGLRESVMVGTDGTLRLKHVADSRAVLEDLLELYRRGLEQPLCFFPKSSLEYARSMRKWSSAARALGSARTAWEGSEAHRGEIEDPYFQRCFETIDPLGAEFVQLSRRVFDPLLDCAVSEASA
jgi:exodeoxyribonuclease V gamma subunit